MTGELVPKSKVDKDKLDQFIAAQLRLVGEIKRAFKYPQIPNRLNMIDPDKLLSFIRFSDFTLGSLQALLDKEEFKVDWGDDDHPYQIVIQTASGPAAFQICENESNFPEGERIEVHVLLVRRSAAYLSRNTRYTFKLLGWG